jgi:hypothetical protein
MKRGRRAMPRLLQAAVAGVLLLAAAALGLPAPWSGRAASAMVALLVGAPAGRVAWLTVRWLRLGDRRFAAWGLGLLAVLAAGALVALVQRALGGSA